MATAQDYIYDALRNCGQLRPGYTPGPELLADCLTRFQDQFDAYNAQRTMQYTQPDYVFPITGPGHGTTGNAQSFGGTGYTIGPTAVDFTVPFRPVAIPRMNLYMTANSPGQPARFPLAQISMEEWLSIITVQFTPTNVCTTYAYDTQYPNGVIWLWPPINGNSVEIFTWGFLTPPSTLATVMALPPGYADAIKWELTKRVWPLCSLDIMPNRLTWSQIAGQARLALQKVKRINAPSPRMVCDFRGGRSSISGTGVADWGLLLAGVPY